MFHDAAPLAVVVAIGLWLAIRQRRRWLAVALGLFLAALAVSLLPGLNDLNRLLAAEHWLVLAAIVAAGGHRHPGPPHLMSLPLVLLAPQGFGALLLAAIIAAKALLEPGAQGRAWLAAALVLLALSGFLDAHLLHLWELGGKLLGLGADSASLLARALAAGVRLAGWGAILRWSVVGPQTPE